MKKVVLLLLSLFIYSMQVIAQWSSNSDQNNLICNAVNNQQDVRICSDGKNGAIMTWADFRTDASNKLADIYVQRINRYGDIKWASNGLAISSHTADQTSPKIIEDGNGGAIIVWQDFRNGTRDIYAQRVDSTGAIVWTADGISIVTKSTHQKGPVIISDGNNGAIIAWEDSINGSLDIFAQRVNASGSILWNSQGVAICNAAGSQINPKICEDNIGGAWFTWQDKRGSDYDIYCQRIDANGAVQFATNGVVICTSANTQSNPKIESDHNGGTYITWQDKRSGEYDVYAQKISSTGVIGWTANGVVVCNAAGSQSAIDAMTEGLNNEIIISWKDARNANTLIYAQKINASGAAQWTSNGVLVSGTTKNKVNPNLVSDNNNGVIVVWQDSVNGTWDVYTQRLNNTGTEMWTVGGIKVASAAGHQESPKNISNGLGGSIYAWEDKRGSDFDVYTFLIDSNGIASSIDNLESNSNKYSVFPNPNNGTFILHQLNSFEAIKMVQIFNVIGNEIYFEFNTGNIISLNQGFDTGVYLCKITDAKGRITYKKFIAVK